MAIVEGNAMLRPELDGDWWMIGDNPALGEIQGLSEEEARKANKSPQECVDHHVFQSADGRWHLWGCIRGTAVGRVLYHWETASITDSHWEQTGEMIRCDLDAGECVSEADGQEWLQSPFVIREGGLFYFFFGGHSTGLEPEITVPQGWKARCNGQICLMTSPDGRSWTRHRDECGRSRLFYGPGEVRDPCLLRVQDGWLLYYAGYCDGDHRSPGFFARRSSDLLHWSQPKLVHQDLSLSNHPWGTECPHVVYRGGQYYLFRTENYAARKSHVFQSEDPLDFGIGDAGGKYVGPFPAAAPEIIVAPDGSEYISSNHDLSGGTHLCRLNWLPQ
jgi:hypothetical protein